MSPLITVITPTTGAPVFKQAMDSVKAQTYKNIQHLVVVDGDYPKARIALQDYQGVDVVNLPYATGKDQYNGHRIYGAMTYVPKVTSYAFWTKIIGMKKIISSRLLTL